MRSVLRFLVLALSIAALTRTIASADTLSSSRALVVVPGQVSTKIETPKSPQLNVAATVDVIPKSYVTISSETKNKTLAQILLNSVNILVKPAAKRIYSLLNWKAQSRTKDIEVISYNRVAHFGKWAQDRSDKTCYNTRAKVLIRDSVTPVIFNSENACSVDKGQWNEPYGGKVLTDAIAEIQIDHMIPLKNAYVSGAHKWDYPTRCLYANYLGESFHLISVDGQENQRKGDKGPDQYMPSNKQYACTYIKNWLTVKTLWGLEMTPAEAEGIKKLVLSEGCKTDDFVISDEEIQEQRKFATANAKLCFERAAADQTATATN